MRSQRVRHDLVTEQQVLPFFLDYKHLFFKRQNPELCVDACVTDACVSSTHFTGRKEEVQRG